MSATNTTTNYNLPIFIETDKPAWLVDFNGAMRSIDAQMKTNADAIATKSPILTFNDTADIDFTKSGDIITANLSSGVAGTVSRALVKPVSAPASSQIASIDSSNNQQMLNLGTGLAVESGTLNAIDLNLTDNGTISALNITTGTNMTIQGSNMRYAFNSDRSIGKIYGYIDIGGSGTGGVTIDLGINIPAPSSEIVINPIGFSASSSGVPGTFGLTIATTGRLSVGGYKGSNTYMRAIIFPCIYFFTNFGDTPDQNG